MRRFFLFCLPLIALASCADLQPIGMAAPPVPTGYYECVPTDSPASARRRAVAIDPDLSSGGLLLRLENGRQIALAPASGASGRFYTAPSYAWRSSADGNVLTDVEAIQTYSCHLSPRAPGRIAR